MGKPQRKQQNRRNRGRKAGFTQSSVITTLATVSGNVLSTRNLTIAQLIPDVTGSRPLIIDRIEVDVMPTTSTALSGPGLALQLLGTAQPMVASGTGPSQSYFASMPYRAVSNTTVTKLVLKSTYPGQVLPVSADTTLGLFRVNGYSVTPATTQLVVRTYYKMLHDIATQVVA